MINIIIKNEYQYYVSILLRLLSIKNINIIYSNTYNDHDNLFNTYLNINKHVYNKLKVNVIEDNLITFLNTYSYFHYAYKNCEIQCFSPSCIKDIELEIFPLIEHIIGVKIDLKNPEFIKWSIKHFYNRIPNENEISHNIENNDIITWLFLIYFSEESKSNGLYNTFSNRSIYNRKIAVIFTGHIRNLEHVYKSHKALIYHPNIDIFIHTWDDKGLKSKDTNKQWIQDDQEKVSIDYIKDLYHPVGICMENNKCMLKDLSYVGKISPIFLCELQAKDDASKYINSQLYSIYQAYLLIEKYQKDFEYEYEGVIKLRFDFNIEHTDLFEIFKNISEPKNCNAVYFPHPVFNCHFHSGGGGGCILCHQEKDNKLHKKHNNDICDIWFYTDKHLMKYVCELYLYTLDILKKNHENNLKFLLENKVKFYIQEEFIYVILPDVEKEIVCFYPERMLREHLENYHCKNSMHIKGKLYSENT